MARDPQWVKDQLLPQFDFEHQGDEAWVVWQPLLEHGKLSRQVANEMLPRYRSAQNTLLADSRDEITNGYLKDAAAIYNQVFADTDKAWLAAIDWRLALPLAVWSLCYAALLRVFVPRMRRVFDERTRVIDEALSSARAVQSEAADQAAGEVPSRSPGRIVMPPQRRSGRGAGRRTHARSCVSRWRARLRASA